MARFEREAKVLASLNHPNVAQIYGVEDRALVMELVEGIEPKGPIPLDEAWRIASQIAAALEYAHERGIVHRDLKPANIKITSDGAVKLLDFGLAKAFANQKESVGNAEHSPTLTIGATEVGVILGTAAYMAPEQAKGKSVDKRADIWAFGVVLYELLTGERLFKGEDVAETLAQVLTKEPAFDRVPAKAQRLLRRCLAKDPKRRLRDIGEAWFLLEDSAEQVGAPLADVHTLKRSWLWPSVAVVLLVVAALAFVAWKHFHEEAPRLIMFSLPTPERGLLPPLAPTVAVSPDGRRVAFEAGVGGKLSLWVRDLDNPAARMLVEIGGAPGPPFWAPDSRRLGFFDGGKLKEVDVAGGPAMTIADTRDTPGSGTWNQDDVIIFGTFSPPGLLRVAAAGGTPVPVTEFDKTRGENSHWAPWFLPDGRHFLYVANSDNTEKSAVYVGDLASKTRKQVIGFGTRAMYVNPGYLLFVRQGALMAQRFDASKIESTADAIPVAERVDSYTPGQAALGHFSASQNGVLMYTSGGAGGDVQLTWFDRTGKKLETVGTPGLLRYFSLSPDETTIAFSRGDSQTNHFDLWTRDLVHGGAESRLTFAGSTRGAVWSADGKHVFFLSDRDGVNKVYQKAANNSAPEEAVEGGNSLPTDASRDGRYLFTTTPGNTSNTGFDIWVVPLLGDRKARPYIQTQFAESNARLSPDGRWLAYQTNQSKRSEIWVVSFPNQGGQWQVSTDGGRDPVWSRDGGELYYYSADNKIMAAAVKPGAGFRFDTPKPLFAVRLVVANVSFDVTKDGRFLVPAQAEQSAEPMTVVLNWPEILKKK
jgi:Tol biopolymer transport system component